MTLVKPGIKLELSEVACFINWNLAERFALNSLLLLHIILDMSGDGRKASGCNFSAIKKT